MPVPAEYLEDDDARLRDAARMWNLGSLDWKLDAHQHLVYAKYRHWEREGEGTIFVLDCGRRWGKSYWVSLVKVEDCLRRPGSIHTIATAHEKDIGEIIIPIMDEICEDSPAETIPRYMGSSMGRGRGFYFPNGSVLRLVGIDVNPKGIRGRHSDGYVITEAAFVKNLAKTTVSKILPQFMRRQRARLILESSAPEDPMHDFDQVFVPSAKRRDAYVFQTIDDNTAMSAEDKARHYAEAAEISPDDAQREYYGKRVRNREKVIIPEFDAPTMDRPITTHVLDFVRPDHACAIVAMDPGMRDLFAVLWCYWDYRRAKLCIERDYAERNASTGMVAEVLRETERELYGDAAEQRIYLPDPDMAIEWRWTAPKPVDRTRFGLSKPSGMNWFDGHQFRANPYVRVSDTEARLIGDLTVDYSISVMNTLKDDKEAALNSLRNAFKLNKIEVHPRCAKTVEHLTSARWNDQRTDYERTDKLGHYDLLDALVYAWRMIQPVRQQDPYPPSFIDKNTDHVLYTPPKTASRAVKSLQDGLGGGRRGAWR